MFQAKEPATFAPGDLLTGRYHFRERTGSGGFGDVYRGYDSLLERDVAIKIARPDPTLAGRTEFAVDMEMALEEARAASALSHPNIITIHDIIQNHEAMQRLGAEAGISPGKSSGKA